MFGKPSEQEQAECDAVVADIHAAFAGVSRGSNGISWNECVALDDYQPEAACEAARRSDRDSCWTELVDDPDWHPFPGVGGFVFINAEGFRYYLPPTMIRMLRGESLEFFDGHLLKHIEEFTTQPLISLWTDEQLRSIARFIAFMALHDYDVCLYPDEPNTWKAALERRWGAYFSSSKS